TGTVYVDDDMYDYIDAGVFTLNASYNITGIGHYSYGLPKILPRFAQDIELVVGVSTAWGENITAYPNPFTNTVWIDNAESASRISVVNLIGQQVISITHDGSNRAMIPTNDLPSGVYLVTIVNNQGQKAVRKMIKR
ncbi:MAG TPA: T9SS type A sorting domain-containing protein, partial [Bacteroidetes bacterium]|nr:T9SS type A sorting domain-containing protein [Bacteroidota bacterium]